MIQSEQQKENRIKKWTEPQGPVGLKFTSDGEETGGRAEKVLKEIMAKFSKFDKRQTYRFKMLSEAWTG